MQMYLINLQRYTRFEVKKKEEKKSLKIAKQFKYEVT